MFTIQMSRNTLQSVACMLLSVVIVSISLALGALAADYAASHERYSVTVTQLS